MSHLIKHAKRELELAGLFDEDADYGGMLGKAAMELIECFSKQGHSGASAEITRDLFARLSDFENLTPITNNIDEWRPVGRDIDNPDWTLAQNKRNSSLFSEDKGITYYHVDDEARTKNISANKNLKNKG